MPVNQNTNPDYMLSGDIIISGRSTVVEAVELADIKAYLNVYNDEDDDLITQLIFAAIALVEQKTSYEIQQLSFQEHFNAGTRFELRHHAEVGVVVERIPPGETDRHYEAIPAQDLIIDGKRITITDSSVQLNTDFQFPIRITYSTAPVQQAEVPYTFTQAIRMIIHNWYYSRDDYASRKTPLAVEELLRNYSANIGRI